MAADQFCTVILSPPEILGRVNLLWKLIPIIIVAILATV